MNEQEIQLDPQKVILVKIDLSLENYVGIVLKLAAAQFVIGILIVLPLACLYGAIVGGS